MSFSNPDNNIKNLQLEPGNRVVIFGSGAGGHSFAAARAMENTGQVYAVDVRMDMLEKMKNEASKEGLAGIEIKHGNVERPGGSGLGDQTVDAVVVPNTLFAYDDQPGIFKEAFRILLHGGRLLVIDWSSSFGGVGPQPEDIVPQSSAKKWALDAGFIHESSFSAGNQHYGLVFQKPAEETVTE